jgi:protein O-GlcNAc transferase
VSLSATPEYYNNLGLAHYAQARLDEAIDCYLRALMIDPARAEILCNLGLAFSARGDMTAAAAAYQRAIDLKPGLAEAHNNLGNIFLAQDRPQEALVCFERALSIRSDLAQAQANLGNVWLRLGRFDDAVSACRKAISIRPDYAEAFNQLGTAYLFGGMAKEAMDAFEHAIELRPGDAGAHSMQVFAMLTRPELAPAEVFAAHRRFAARFETQAQADRRPHLNFPDPERRLKIGYVSPNFYRHSVASFISPILAHHDKTQFDVYCYYNHARVDEVTEQIRGYADHWLPCKGWADSRLAEQIRADGIDVLVDLAGHTRDHRLLTFARKPAPVQVTYLGYPATTGLAAMDFRLSHADLDPAGSEAWHSEKLFYLPRTPWCYRPPVDDGLLPSREDTPEGPVQTDDGGTVTFGSLNTFSKVTDEALELWAQTLGAVPDSRLVMTHVPEGSPRRRVHGHFAAQGVDPDRLILHHYLPGPEFRALQRRIDIGLDTFPYNGTTTTCDSLWQGIPVITLKGETSVARSGYALLRMLGLEEFIARDHAEYRRLAIDLARQPARRRDLRAGLRARFEASPLRDEVGATRDLEAAYRTMWRMWCDR